LTGNLIKLEGYGVDIIPSMHFLNNMSFDAYDSKFRRNTDLGYVWKMPDINKIDKTFDNILNNKSLYIFNIPILWINVNIDTYAIMDIYQFTDNREKPFFGDIWINDKYSEAGYRQFVIEL